MEPENLRSYECTMADTQDTCSDTVSLRSCDVDACHSAPIVTLVTLYLLVWIRRKNTVTRCASPVYDITDPTVRANGCPADMLSVTLTRQFVIVHEKRLQLSVCNRLINVTHSCISTRVCTELRHSSTEANNMAMERRPTQMHMGPEDRSIRTGSL